MTKIRPELRQTAAETRNAYARYRVSAAEASKHMDEVRRLVLRLRRQGASTWTIAELLNISQTMVRKVTKPLERTGA